MEIWTGAEGEEKKEEEEEEEMEWGKDISILEFCHKPRNSQRHRLVVEQLREASHPQAGAQSYAVHGHHSYWESSTPYRLKHRVLADAPFC